MFWSVKWSNAQSTPTLRALLLLKMAGVFAVLPRECWMNVLESLPAGDLRQCLFVSKYWNALATPYLYRETSWSWRPIPARRLSFLICAVLNQPKRASHIQHVRLLSDQNFTPTQCWEPPDCATDSTEDIIDFKDIVQWATAIIEDATFPDARVWIQELEGGNSYAYVSVLLSQLHNLRSLHLDYTFV